MERPLYTNNVDATFGNIFPVRTVIPEHQTVVIFLAKSVYFLFFSILWRIGKNEVFVLMLPLFLRTKLRRGDGRGAGENPRTVDARRSLFRAKQVAALRGRVEYRSLSGKIYRVDHNISDLFRVCVIFRAKRVANLRRHPEHRIPSETT